MAASLALDLQGPAGAAIDSGNSRRSFQKMLLSSPVIRIGGGTSEIQRNVIGEQVLGLPPDVRVDKGVPFNKIPVGRTWRRTIIMPSYEQMVCLQAKDVPTSYTLRDTLLYALSVGMGRDPVNRDELLYLYEGYALRTVPSQAVTVAVQDLIWNTGIDVPKCLHGEQKLTLHRQLPLAANLLADHRVVEVYDRGPGKGSIIETESKVRLAADGQPLFDVSSRIVARGDDGMGSATARPSAPHPIPARKPDLVRVAETRPDQALLYRLTGDMNLVHIDPDLAQSVGFRVPILQGSCTYGFVCRDVLAGVCKYDNSLMKTFGARFTSVVYPGEHIETQMWMDGDIVSFRSRALERDVVVLDHGKCTLARR